MPLVYVRLFDSLLVSLWIGCLAIDLTLYKLPKQTYVFAIYGVCQGSDRHLLA